MNNLFVGTYLVWLISEIVLNRMLHSKSTDKQGADKNSLLIIWIIVVAAVAAALFISLSIYIPIAQFKSIRYIGLGIIIAGIILRFVAVITLGRYFTVDVTIREGHQLVQRGFYKYFRHPSYTASLLTFIGFGVSLNNVLSLAVVAVAVIAAFKMRINIEEKALTDQFGEKYTQYKKEAWGLIPFIH